MKPEIRSGIAVISKKGRDKGRLFMVLYELDADFVMICDGDLRKLERPKKKRRKHLSPTSLELKELTALYRLGRLKNSDVRTALAPFNETLTLSQDAPK